MSTNATGYAALTRTSIGSDAIGPSATFATAAAPARAAANASPVHSSVADSRIGDGCRNATTSMTTAAVPSPTHPASAAATDPRSGIITSDQTTKITAATPNKPNCQRRRSLRSLPW